MDEPNFMKDVPNFVKDITSVPACVRMRGLGPKHFLMGSQMKLWTLGDKMGVPKAIGWDVSNFLKHVPNFVKNIPNFANDVLRVPKCILRWGLTTNNFLMGFQMNLWTLGIR